MTMQLKRKWLPYGGLVFVHGFEGHPTRKICRLFVGDVRGGIHLYALYHERYFL